MYTERKLIKPKTNETLVKMNLQTAVPGNLNILDSYKVIVSTLCFLQDILISAILYTLFSILYLPYRQCAPWEQRLILSLFWFALQKDRPWQTVEDKKVLALVYAETLKLNHCKKHSGCDQYLCERELEILCVGLLDCFQRLSSCSAEFLLFLRANNICYNTLQCPEIL